MWFACRNFFYILLDAHTYIYTHIYMYIYKQCLICESSELISYTYMLIEIYESQLSM